MDNWYRPAVSSSGHQHDVESGHRYWIVELRTVEAEDWAHGAPIFHGDVLEQRFPPGPAWSTITIRHERAGEPLTLTADRVDLRVQPTDLPAEHTAGRAFDVNHVVHMWCAGGLDPEAIEEFLTATWGIAAHYAQGREAWLEVLAHAVDPEGGESREPMFDDIFLGRYADVDALARLDADPRWSEPSDRLHAAASSRLDLVIQPEVNRIAEHR